MINDPADPRDSGRLLRRLCTAPGERVYGRPVYIDAELWDEGLSLGGIIAYEMFHQLRASRCQGV